MLSKVSQKLPLLLFLGLLIWGLYSFVIYLGVPAHSFSLVSPTDEKTLEASCGGLTNYFCRGAVGFLPFIFTALGKATVLIPYIIISLLVFAIVYEWRYLKKHSLAWEVKLKPLHILLGFLASAWLIFTIISFYVKDSNFSQLILNPDLAQSASVTSYQVQQFRTNLTSLEGMGCILNDSTTGLNHFSSLCAQEGFLVRVFPQLLVISIILFEFLVVGKAILDLSKLKIESRGLEFVIASSLGICFFVTVLWLGAVLSVFNPIFAWILVLLVPLSLFKQSKYWLKFIVTPQWELSINFKSSALFLGWFLVSVAALSFISVIRPIPMGWDDSRTYLNLSHLMAEFGHFLPQLSSFHWEYLTSLGFLLFGSETSFGTSTALVINWLPSVLSVLYIIAFCSYFLGKNRGLIASSIFFTLPMIGFLTFEDLKVDNSVFLLTVAVVSTLFLALFPKEGQTKKKILIIVSALVLGFCISFKVTSLITFIALAITLAAVRLKRYSIVGIVVGFAVAIFGGLYHIINYELPLAPSLPRLVLVGLIVATIAFYAFIFFNKKGLREALWEIVLFVGVVVLTLVPWIAHNVYLAGNLSFDSAIRPPDSITLRFDPGQQGIDTEAGVVRSLPDNLKMDLSKPECVPSAQKEELDRYQGSIGNLFSYLLLPWETLMNINYAGYYVTLSFIFALFPLVLLLKYFYSKEGEYFKWLTIATIIIIIEWIFFARGIPWYGIGMFLGLCVALEVLVNKAPDKKNRILTGSLVAVAIVISLVFRIDELVRYQGMFAYPMAEISPSLTVAAVYSEYPGIVNKFEELKSSHPNTPYLYLMGTSITYFIPKNIEVIGADDSQLDDFNCLYAERDPKLTLQRLKALGFNSIVVDTNLQTIEYDKNGSLHKKYAQLLNFINSKEIKLNKFVWNPQAGIGYVVLP